MPRLRRSDCSAPGIVRRRRGRGFQYTDADGRAIEDLEALERIRALSIPPAWRRVWICADPLGHLQATGIDAAGRKQYLYHERWRAHRDRRKFEQMLRFGRALPRLRRRVARDIALSGFPRERVLAVAVKMLDLGFFRIGSEDYAERNESYGLATMLREHVSVNDGYLVFDYPAKSGQRRVQALADDDVLKVISVLMRRRGGGPELLAYRMGRRWTDVRSEDINAYLKETAGGDFTAKDFRTWNATVLAAVALGVSALDSRGRVSSERASAGRGSAGRASPGHEPPGHVPSERAIAGAVRNVASYLGNTPAVCRGSYIDPQVIDRYRAGVTIRDTLRRCMAEGGPDLANARVRRRVEKAVLELLGG